MCRATNRECGLWPEVTKLELTPVENEEGVQNGELLLRMVRGGTVMNFDGPYRVFVDGVKWEDGPHLAFPNIEGARPVIVLKDLVRLPNAKKVELFRDLVCDNPLTWPLTAFTDVA